MQKDRGHTSTSEVPDKRARAGRALAGVEPPSREALEAVRRRDPQALAAFFDRYATAVYSLSYRMLGDREVAEDVTQDVFYKVQRAIDRLDPERDPGPWLTAITCNTCRKHWRSKQFRVSQRTLPWEDTPGLDERLPGPAADPAAHLLTKEQSEHVQEALQSLPEPLREAVVLHAYQGLGHDQIAETLGISHAAARKRYSRALAELGQRLTGWFERRRDD
ncbi:MAG: sigma-70 family RNA polymerase sigma factor [Candidatus Eisenbacteria bacterium]